MRILHIDTGVEMRGGQHQVLLLLNALREAAHESLLLANSKGLLWEAARSDGFPVFAAEAKQAWQQSRTAAIVHAHDARAHTMAAIASRRKFVVSRRVAFPVRRSLASVWKYQRAARFLAVSQFVAGELQTAGIRAEKIDVVYDGVGVNTSAEPWSAAYPAVALSSTDPEKGRGLVEQAASIAGIPVVFSDDLVEDLRRASMFVYITRSEGLGSAALVAMSMGVPVIGSKVGGMTEVFADAVSGVLVENEPSSIASAMRRILDDSAFAHGLIEHAKSRVEERFSKRHLLEGTLASYGRALGA